MKLKTEIISNIICGEFGSCRMNGTSSGLGSHCQCAITVILIFNQVLLLQSEDPFPDKVKSRNEAIIHHWNHKFRHSPFAVDAMLRGNIDSTCVDKSNNCNVDMCWGYEQTCSKENRLFLPYCEEPAKPWSSSMEEKHELFWRQGDYGYVKDVADTLKTLCKPRKQDESSLVCSTNMRFCKATNLLLDLRRFEEFANRPGDTYRSFREDIFESEEVGGYCKLDRELLRQQGAHKSPLQSWYAELEEYTELDFNPFITDFCDEVITTPTVFIKLDAGINLYHHYCDFFNLYASQHVNGSFNMDIKIIVWDTSYGMYRDLFSDTWKAFSYHPIQMLSDFANKKVCFTDVMFPLLARMRGGLYYNTYIVPGCYNSGLMMAFTKHISSRLNITQEYSEPDEVRVTLLSRSSKHRRIVNEDELVQALKTVSHFSVKVVNYNFRTYPFLEQIKTSHNSDIFIGMHGAGLTHLLFLPDWASVFEIYNTEDVRCYSDLARLRGVQYITWEDGTKIWKENEGLHPQLGTPHAKFTNYTFDVNEFMRLMTKLGDDVRERKQAYKTHKLLG